MTEKLRGGVNSSGKLRIALNALALEEEGFLKRPERFETLVELAPLGPNADHTARASSARAISATVELFLFQRQVIRYFTVSAPCQHFERFRRRTCLSAKSGTGHFIEKTP
jgi:hypothetical protein